MGFKFDKTDQTDHQDLDVMRAALRQYLVACVAHTSHIIKTSPAFAFIKKLGCDDESELKMFLSQSDDDIAAEIAARFTPIEVLDVLPALMELRERGNAIKLSYDTVAELLGRLDATHEALYPNSEESPESELPEEDAREIEFQNALQEVGQTVPQAIADAGGHAILKYLQSELAKRGFDPNEYVLRGIEVPRPLNFQMPKDTVD